jgi:transcriptional regulator with XRE-family HTH domain
LTHLQHQIVKNSWSEVRKQLDIDEQVVARERVRLRLAVLREQLGKSQIELAELLGTSQPDVTQLERSEDLQLSSISKYIHALGGQLQVNAVVGNTTYRLTDDLGESVSATP